MSSRTESVNLRVKKVIFEIRDKGLIFFMVFMWFETRTGSNRAPADCVEIFFCLKIDRIMRKASTWTSHIQQLTNMSFFYIFSSVLEVGA